MTYSRTPSAILVSRAPLKIAYFHAKTTSAKLNIYIGEGSRDLFIDKAHTVLGIFQVFFPYMLPTSLCGIFCLFKPHPDFVTNHLPITPIGPLGPHIPYSGDMSPKCQNMYAKPCPWNWVWGTGAKRALPWFLHCTNWWLFLNRFPDIVQTRLVCDQLDISS